MLSKPWESTLIYSTCAWNHYEQKLKDAMQKAELRRVSLLPPQAGDSAQWLSSCLASEVPSLMLRPTKNCSCLIISDSLRELDQFLGLCPWEYFIFLWVASNFRQDKDMMQYEHNEIWCLKITGLVSVNEKPQLWLQGDSFEEQKEDWAIVIV